MTSFPNSSKLLKGGIVLIDADTSALLRIIALQYNPDSLSGTLQIKALAEGADRSDVMRLIHPQLAALETIVYPASSQISGKSYIGEVRTQRK